MITEANFRCGGGGLITVEGEYNLITSRRLIFRISFWCESIIIYIR